jgi:MerR family transcriptional regulator, redox-sensitive transcriptional activator SoxR
MHEIVDPAEETLTIGQLAKHVGLPVSTVRYYERRGLIPPPGRSGGWRRYDPGAVEVLAVIEVAKEAGFTLEETKQLLTGFEPDASPSVRWARMAERKLEELDELARRIDEMRELLNRGLACGCLTVEDCQILRQRIQRPDSSG